MELPPGVVEEPPGVELPPGSELPGVVLSGVVEEPPGVELPPGAELPGMEEGLPVFIVSEGELLLLPLGVSMLPPAGGVLIPPEGVASGVVEEPGVVLLAPALDFLVLAFFFLLGVGVA
jgi:hypothetical protein